MDFDKVIRGILKYLDREIYVNMNDWQRLIARAAVGRMVSNSEGIKQLLSGNGFLRTFALLDGNGNVDVDGLIGDLSAVMDQPVTINVPLFGAFTFTADDLSKLHQYIREA